MEEYPTPTEANLWPQVTPEGITLTIWSPTAEEVRLSVYEKGEGDNRLEQLMLSSGKKGLWSIRLNGGYLGRYYTFQVKVEGEWLDETPGIYAQTTGLNGKRAMIVDLDKTNPEGWENDWRPKLAKYNDAIIYEMHIRDLTIDPESGAKNKGNYLGVSEKGLKGPGGVATGLDHLEEMGITHVHILPAFDYGYLDEKDDNQYNWGYSPVNYNVPEGSYSSDPSDGAVRVKEFKMMVKALHDAEIGVILDVVYNHTAHYDISNFNLEVPRYYYRHNEDGSPSDAAACGNETASERAMMRKYMLESVLYWMKEYHIDGFRFDLMAIHDQETMNLLADTLRAINPNVIIYGEGWDAGSSPLPAEERAFKKYTYKMPSIAAFSDEVRDGMKGSVFEDEDIGFISGKPGMQEAIKMGIVGCVSHPQVDNAVIRESDSAWAKNPWQSMVYVSCHDNHTLYDKLVLSRPDASQEEIEAMVRMAGAIILTSQGNAFLHAGVEMLRTKQGDHNSYESPDSINQINWAWKAQNQEMVDFFIQLIELRKAHPAFRMSTGDQVRQNVRFDQSTDDFISYEINGQVVEDSWHKVKVAFNVSKNDIPYSLFGKWKVALSGKEFYSGKMVEGEIVIPALATLIAFQE